MDSSTELFEYLLKSKNQNLEEITRLTPKKFDNTGKFLFVYLENSNIIDYKIVNYLFPVDYKPTKGRATFLHTFLSREISNINEKFRENLRALRYQDSLKIQDDDGETPIFKYIKNKFFDVNNLRYLVKDCNFNIKNKKGEIFHMFLDINLFQNIDLFKNIETYKIKNIEGNNILMNLFSNHKILEMNLTELEIIEKISDLLLMSNLNEQNKYGKNVVMLAIENENYQNYPNLLKKLITDENKIQEDKFGRKFINYKTDKYLEESLDIDVNFEIELVDEKNEDLFSIVSSQAIPFGEKYYKCKNKKSHHLIGVREYEKWVSISEESTHVCFCSYRFDTKKQFLNIDKFKFKENKFVEKLLRVGDETVNLLVLEFPDGLV